MEALFLWKESLPSVVKERAPVVHTSTHRGLPLQRSQVMVFPFLGWIIGAENGQAYIQDLHPTHHFSSVMTAPLSSRRILAFVGQMFIQGASSQCWQTMGR